MSKTSKHLKKETLANKAYRLIKSKLLDGEYMPGQFLQVEDVGGSIGIGRTPVHQALHKLGQEGLLEIIPRKGILVRADSMDDIRQSIQLRILLEPYCAQRLAEAVDSETIDKLNDITARQAALGSKPPFAEMMELDHDLHSFIVEKSGNHLIANILKPIHERMTRTWLMPHWRSHDFVQTGNDHNEVIKAIQNGNGKKAAETMRKHLESVRNRMGLV